MEEDCVSLMVRTVPELQLAIRRVVAMLEALDQRYGGQILPSTRSTAFPVDQSETARRRASRTRFKSTEMLS